MKIEGREVTEENQYDLVTYVPMHANGDAGHADCQQGVIINTTKDHVNVLYCNSRRIQATYPEHLVWG